MESTSDITSNNAIDHLSSMPTEISINIFSLLPSFSDVFALAATCHRHNLVWTENITPIYNQVAPRSIPCEPDARRLLADQGGSPFESLAISPRDVLCLVRNSRIVEKAIIQYEKEIVCKVRRIGSLEEVFYEKHSARQHPPYITITERPRFIRTYYQVWGMLIQDATKWQSRLETMSLNQIFYLVSICQLPQRLRTEESLPLPHFPLMDSGSNPLIDSEILEKRNLLRLMGWDYLKDIYTRIHGQDGYWPWSNFNEGYLWYLIWDHWQPTLKYILCCQRPSQDVSRSLPRKIQLWDELDDGSDEEQQM